MRERNVTLNSIVKTIMNANAFENVMIIYRGVEYTVLLGVLKVQNRQK